MSRTETRSERLARLTLGEAIDICRVDAQVRDNDEAHEALAEWRFQRTSRPAPTTEAEESRREQVIDRCEREIIRVARHILVTRHDVEDPKTAVQIVPGLWVSL